MFIKMRTATGHAWIHAGEIVRMETGYDLKDDKVTQVRRDRLTLRGGEEIELRDPDSAYLLAELLEAKGFCEFADLKRTPGVKPLLF